QTRQKAWQSRPGRQARSVLRSTSRSPLSSRFSGGTLTEPRLSPHRIWKAPPCHGARGKRTLQRFLLFAGELVIPLDRFRPQHRGWEWSLLVTAGKLKVREKGGRSCPRVAVQRSRQPPGYFPPPISSAEWPSARRRRPPKNCAA